VRAEAFRAALDRARATELGGLASDSFYVGIWQGATSLAYFAQIVLITHALGLHEYGRLALLLSFVVLVGQFFDLRVGAAATTFGARRLHKGDLGGAAGAFQLSYLIDGSTGLLGFGVVAALSPFVGPRLVGGDGTALILLYGLTLLASTVNDTSVAILRLLDRFKLIAVYTVGLEGLRVAFVGAGLLVSKSLASVLVALVVHDTVQGLANVVAAGWAFRSRTGMSLRQRWLSGFDEWRAFARMTLHTNVVSYARLAQTQLPVLLVGALSNATQVGIYSVGTGAAGAVGRLADFAYGAVLPRLSRLWVAGSKRDVRILVEHATAVATPLLTVVLLVLVVFREPVLRLLGGHGAGAAGTVLILVGAAQALNGALFWNVGLLYAARRSGGVAAIALAGLVLQVVLLVPLVLLFNANGAAGAFLASIVVTNAAATILALKAAGTKDDRRLKSPLAAQAP
jgi:O-antigen/teichoic acid export membrane protein